MSLYVGDDVRKCLVIYWLLFVCCVLADSVIMVDMVATKNVTNVASTIRVN